MHSPWAVLDVPAAVLIGFGFAAIGMFGTTYMKSWQDFDYVILASMPLFLFSATFYPLSVYPRPAQIVIEWRRCTRGSCWLRDPPSAWSAPACCGGPGTWPRWAWWACTRPAAGSGNSCSSDHFRWPPHEVSCARWGTSSQRHPVPNRSRQAPAAVGSAADGLTAFPAAPSTDPVTWAIAVVAFGAYAAIGLFRLIELNPSSWDLSIYTEYVKQYASLHAPIVDVRAPGFNLLGDHFQPIVAVMAPFFRVFPSSATLVVGQALLVAASIFPVSQLAREKLGACPARAIAVAYAFSWGLQQLAQFDFHEIAFAVPLLAFSLSALARGHTRAAVGWALPLVFVKEDQAPSPWPPSGST